MSKEKKLRGPWQSVQTAIWLIGLAILAWQDWWWPGILVLIAISILSQAMIQSLVPGAIEEEGQEEKMISEAPAASAMATAATAPAATAAIFPTEPKHPIHRLPSECPKCSAPIRGGEARWTGPESADCPYCGANLPLKQDNNIRQ